MVEKVVNISKKYCRLVLRHMALLLYVTCHANGVDLTLVGQVWHGDGLGKIAINFIECLKVFKDKDKVSITMRTTHDAPVYEDLPSSVRDIVNRETNDIGDVAILTDIPWFKGIKKPNILPHGALIKLAYSMIESTRIPKQWVLTFNRHFDAVLVPDQFFVKVYKDSGVTVPIFVLPIAMDLKRFLESPLKNEPGKPFIFGNISQIRPHKNVKLLIRAFHKAFGNNPDVKLVLNARYAKDPQSIRDVIKEIGATNIQFHHGALKFDDMLALMKTFDCYVSFSKGEGFSLIPREMLALGTPVIISDNTAQSTICKSGHVRAVPQSGRSKARYEHLTGDCGFQFETSLQDAVDSLLDVYNNYPSHLEKARMGRKWVEKYGIEYLGAQYLSLVKPKEIKLGAKNIITPQFIETTDRKLLAKFKKLTGKKAVVKPEFFGTTDRKLLAKFKKQAGKKSVASRPVKKSKKR